MNGSVLRGFVVAASVLVTTGMVNAAPISLSCRILEGSGSFQISLDTAAQIFVVDETSMLLGAESKGVLFATSMVDKGTKREGFLSVALRKSDGLLWYSLLVPEDDCSENCRSQHGRAQCFRSIE